MNMTTPTRTPKPGIQLARKLALKLIRPDAESSAPVPSGTAGLRGTLRNDVDMRRFTSWRAGGRAQHLYQPADLADLIVFLRALPMDEPITAIGLGSNLLVRDGGLPGTVLLLHAALTELRITSHGMLYAQAGVPGAKLARFAALQNLQGAEFFAGIPGTLGGMLAMNAGCYGSETWNAVAQVQVVTRTGGMQERAPHEYEVGYRQVQRIAAIPARIQERRGHVHSSIPDSHLTELFVGAWFKFPPGDGDVARGEIKALLTKRIATQPLNLPNAGSVFRNPPGEHAARLIEMCGLKGRQIGGARVSEKHANFIVNVGQATALDIENVIHEVQSVVLEKTGIKLHQEVQIIGEVL